MSQKTLTNLKTALEAGDYYGALQMYRTLVKRKLDGGSVDDAGTMVREGAQALVGSSRPVEGADLLDLMVKSYETRDEVLSEVSIGRVCSVAAVFPGTSPTASAALAPVLRAAARWATHARLHTGGPRPGVDGEEEGEADHQARRALVATLHGACAGACEGAGLEFAADAARHYLEAGQSKRFGAFLYAWACKGLAGEADLFLARALLQLLVLGRLGEANEVRDEFLRLVGEAAAAAPASGGTEMGEEGGSGSGSGSGASTTAAAAAASNAAQAMETPLAHFLKFLLLACERDAGPLFTQLCSKYAPSLARDPSFSGMLTIVGQRFFNIAPPTSGMDNLMANMMGMMGGGGGGGPPNPMAMLQQMMGGGGMGGGGGRGGGGGNPLAALMSGMQQQQQRR